MGGGLCPVVDIHGRDCFGWHGFVLLRADGVSWGYSGDTTIVDSRDVTLQRRDIQVGGAVVVV